MSGILKQALNDTLSFETSSLDALRLTLIDLLEHTDEALLVTEFISQCPEGTIVECVPELSHALGCSQLVDVLRRVWSQLNESQKLNIAMVAGVCESLSDDLWSFLFEDPSNTVHVRHRIAAGLAHSRNEVTRKLFPTLLSKIGKYDDPMRQAVLEGFLKNYG